MQEKTTDDTAVDRFAQAMKAKLAEAREKGRSGWETCPPEELSRMLREHVDKGDTRDVANFCAFLWNLRAPISPLAPSVEDLEQENRLIRARNERLEKENAQLRQHLQVLRTGIKNAKEHLNDYYRRANAGRYHAASSSVADAEFLITKAYVQTNEGERNG